MKGQVAIILLILFLIVGVIAFFIVSIVFLPILKSIVVTPVLEPPIVGVITALFGFLPEQCSVLTNLDCRFCLTTNKILPLVVNTVFGLILFSVILRFAGGPTIEWGGKEDPERRWRGLIRNYGISLLISIAFSIFMLHQPNPLIFLNWMTFLLAIVVRVLLFMVQVERDRDEAGHVASLRRLTDFFLAANILVTGWENWYWILIMPLVAIIWATAVSNGRPNYNLLPVFPNLLILLGFSFFIGFYIFAIFENIPILGWTPLGSLPTKIEFHGLPSYIIEKANLPELKGLECGRNTIGPESSISI